jgi:hypothetical protein
VSSQSSTANALYHVIQKWMDDAWPHVLFEAIHTQTARDSDDDLVERLVTLYRENIVSEPKVAWALGEAAWHGLEGTTKLLLENNAEINGRLEPSADETPLMKASRMGHIEIVRLLLRRGADVTIRNDSGKSARDLATNSQIIELLDQPPAVEGPSIDSVPSTPTACLGAQHDHSFDSRPSQSTLASDMGCNRKFQGKVVDFTITEKEQHNPINMNVFDMVYDKGPGPRAPDVSFRWLHLPANNVCLLDVHFASRMRKLLTILFS